MLSAFSPESAAAYNQSLVIGFTPAPDVEALRSALGDLVAGVRDGHASAVLAASIFHFGEATVAEAKAALANAGLPVRPA